MGAFRVEYTVKKKRDGRIRDGVYTVMEKRKGDGRIRGGVHC